MANTKGNAYPLWGINTKFQVFASGSDHQENPMSNENFAMDIAVAEDGTIWVLSTKPDPDGGGSKIYWGNGDNQWNEINTSDPGGMQIAGYVDDSCLYLDWDGNLRSLSTAGETKVISKNVGIEEFDYGGGYIWALLPKEIGGIPILQFSPAGDSLNFTAFAGDIYPFDLTVDYAGNCQAVNNFSPTSYSKDGHSSFSSGAGADNQTLQITSKNWTYILTTDVNQDGNQVCIWQDEGGGLFQKMSLRASKIATTYYEGNR